MTSVRQHLVSLKEFTPLYKLENLEEVSTRLPKGNWLGVIERKSDRLRVITTQGSGWIKSEDTSTLKSNAIRILQAENGSVQYGMHLS